MSEWSLSWGSFEETMLLCVACRELIKAGILPEGCQLSEAKEYIGYAQP